MAKEEFNAKIIDRQDLNGFLTIFKVRPDSGVIPEWESGQFAMLGLPEDLSVQPPKWIKRAYSIASAPKETGHLEYIIVLVEEGQLTPRLWKTKVGDPIFLGHKITGHFTLEPIPSDADIWFLATGTGIAPFVSMLRQYEGQKRWNRVVLVHGVRFAADLCYQDELIAYQKRNPEFQYYAMATREPEGNDWTGLRGRTTTLLKDGAFEKLTGVPLDPARLHVMMCGNPDMIVQVQKELEEKGFKKHVKRDPGNLHFEKYW